MRWNIAALCALVVAFAWPGVPAFFAGVVFGAWLAFAGLAAWLKFEEWDELRQLRQVGERADT